MSGLLALVRGVISRFGRGSLRERRRRGARHEAHHVVAVAACVVLAGCLVPGARGQANYGAAFGVPGGSGSGSGSGGASVAIGELSNVLAVATSGTKYTLAGGTNFLRGRAPANGATFYAADLELTNKSDIVIEGQGRAVLYGTNDGILLAIRDCTNILFRNIEFRGFKTNSGTFQKANLSTFGIVQCSGTNQLLQFQNCKFVDGNCFGFNGSVQVGSANWYCIDAKFDNCWFLNVGHTNYDGVLDGGALQVSYAADVVNCVFDRCSRGIEIYSIGLGLPSAYHLNVSFCDFRNGWARNIMCHGGASQMGRHHILNSRFMADPNAISSGFGGFIVLQQSTAATIENCIFTNAVASGISAPCIYAQADAYGDSGPLRIINNEFADGANGVWFFRVLGGVISGNRFTRLTDSALWISASDVIVEKNTFEQCCAGAGLAVLSAAAGIPATNMLFTENLFIRRSGSLPPRWIDVDSSCRNTTIRQNLVFDPGATPLLQDAGVNTVCVDGFNTSGTFRQRISGAGNGNTNYTLLGTVPVTYIGMSNVNIAAIMQTTANHLQTMKVYVTNDSADTWGLSMPATTNRYRFWGLQGGGTNAPTVLSNNTVLTLDIETEGTNALVKYTYHRPAK